MNALLTDIVSYIDESTLSGMVFALYMAALVVFVFLNKKDEDNFVKSVIWPGIIMFVGLYFALMSLDYFIVKVAKITGQVVDRDIRPRYAWILMVTAVLALAFTYFVKRIDGNVKKLLAVISICVLLFSAGEMKINSYVYKSPENLYKFPQSVVDIANKVLEEKEEPKLCVPVSAAYPFRQISSRIKLLYGDDIRTGRIVRVKGKIMEVGDQMDTSLPDLYFITDVLRENDVDYIVLDQVYMEFGKTSLNDEGYEANHVYLGGREPIETEHDKVDHTKELESIKVIDKNTESEHWDLSEFGLDYEGTYGQYLLYKIK